MGANNFSASEEIKRLIKHMVKQKECFMNCCSSGNILFYFYVLSTQMLPLFSISKFWIGNCFHWFLRSFENKNEMKTRWYFCNWKWNLKMQTEISQISLSAWGLFCCWYQNDRKCFLWCCVQLSCIFVILLYLFTQFRQTSSQTLFGK